MNYLPQDKRRVDFLVVTSKIKYYNPYFFYCYFSKIIFFVSTKIMGVRQISSFNKNKQILYLVYLVIASFFTPLPIGISPTPPLCSSPFFVPYGIKKGCAYICSLTYCLIMLEYLVRWHCLEGGRSPTGRQCHRKPP